MKLLKLTAAIATAIALTSVSAAATITGATANAKVTILASCAFSVPLNDLDFGSVTPTLASPPVNNIPTTSAKIRCTNGTPYTTTLNKAATMAGATPIAYSAGVLPASGAGTGMGAGQDITLTVTGTISGAAYENATPGTYQDNTLSITVGF